MFGFPLTERAKKDGFKKNFLKSVIFQVKFNENEKILHEKSKIIETFKDSFPRNKDKNEAEVEVKVNSDQTPIVQPISNKAIGFELKSEDGQKTISISTDTITFTIAGNVYKNFQTIQEELSNFKKVFNLIDINSFNRTAIRKVNIIDFEIPEGKDYSPMDIIGMLINNQLLSNVGYFPNPRDIQQNIHTVKYVKDSENLVLRYGLIIPNPKELKSGKVLIDIDMFNSGELMKDNLNEKLEEINSEIFNIFNWSLSEEAIKELKTNSNE